MGYSIYKEENALDKQDNGWQVLVTRNTGGFDLIAVFKTKAQAMAKVKSLRKKSKATRFRFRDTKKGKQRLGFRNNVVVEVTSFRRKDGKIVRFHTRKLPKRGRS